MSTITVYEFGAYDPTCGQPLHPPSKRATAQALDTAYVCQPNTTCVQVVPDVNVRLRTSRDGSAATSADYYCAANGVATILAKADPTLAKPLQVYATAG